MPFQVGDKVIVRVRRGRDREAEIVQVITSTVYRVRYTGKDAIRAGTFPVSITNLSKINPEKKDD